jgi:hypothetical protein
MFGEFQESLKDSFLFFNDIVIEGSDPVSHLIRKVAFFSTKNINIQFCTLSPRRN